MPAPPLRIPAALQPSTPPWMNPDPGIGRHPYLPAPHLQPRHVHHFHSRRLH
ncbi:MAG: hypothetical protein MZV64_24405 [Ignavibacteriales bacterium]|nr:hypothetical protein [Ignavibacteriales bacterium]